MIIIDYSAISVSSILSQKDAEITEGFIRHMILNTIRSHVHKFKGEYGPEVIIACDDRSWRRRIFPHYKHKRRSDRESSSIDWSSLFDNINLVRDELIEYMPYKVLQVPEAEADDIIGVLVESTQDFGKNEKVMIVSGDKDFLQLQKYPNVKQYSPSLKKLMVEKNPSFFLFEHIVRGDSSDGIPNIFSPDDFFLQEGRQKAIMSKKVLEWYENLGNLSQVMEEDIYRNWNRNRELIDLSRVPVDVEKSILNAYENTVAAKRSSILKYFIAKRLKSLIQSIEEF